MLIKIWDRGWRPQKLWSDPVVWRPRRWNLGADYLCNLAMDTSQNWKEVDAAALADALRSGCNLQLHSDGGLRQGSCAATGWTLSAWTYSRSVWTRKLVAKQCMFLKVPCSSFLAETLALEAALNFATRILNI